MNKFVYDYWNKTELGRKMIASESVSDYDLLFLIPNNVKRRHGLPVTRIHGKRKSVIKKNRKRKILSFKLFDIVSDLIDEMIPQTYNSEFFGQFVDFQNVMMGDNHNFVAEPFDKSKIVTIPTLTKPVKLYLENI